MAIRRHNKIDASEFHNVTISQKQEISKTVELLTNNPAAMDSLTPILLTSRIW